MLENVIASVIARKVLSSIYGGLKGYYGLDEYARVLFHRARGNIIKYNQESEFWKDVIGPYFHEPSPTNLVTGQAVELRDFHVTEWSPRCPGLIWTTEAKGLRESAQMHRHRDLIEQAGHKLGIYTQVGKTYMVLGGLGTTRIDKITGTESGEKIDYRILCGTSSGMSDQGVPLVVAESVYDELKQELIEEGTVLANLTGFYSELPVDWKDTIIDLPSARDFSPMLKEELKTTLHVPRHCIVIKSRKLVSNIRTTSLDPTATAWTLFKHPNYIYSDRTDDPQNSCYSFTFATFNPKNEESIKKAANFLIEYIQEYKGTEIYTDFDKKIRRLRSLSSEFSDYFKFMTDRENTQKEILEWGVELKKNYSFRDYVESNLDLFSRDA